MSWIDSLFFEYMSLINFRYEEKFDDYGIIMVKALADRLAEVIGYQDWLSDSVMISAFVRTVYYGIIQFNELFY